MLKYSPQHFAVKHPQYMFFPQGQRSSFTSILPQHIWKDGEGHEDFSQYGKCPGDSNPRTSEYEAGVQTSQPIWAVGGSINP